MSPKKPALVPDPPKPETLEALRSAAMPAALRKPGAEHLKVCSTCGNLAMTGGTCIVDGTVMS